MNRKKRDAVKKCYEMEAAKREPKNGKGKMEKTRSIGKLKVLV